MRTALILAIILLVSTSMPHVLIGGETPYSILVPTKTFPGTIVPLYNKPFTLMGMNITPTYAVGFTHYIVLLGRTRSNPMVYLKIIDYNTQSTIREQYLGTPCSSIKGYKTYSAKLSHYLIIGLRTPVGIEAYTAWFNKPGIPVKRIGTLRTRIVSGNRVSAAITINGVLLLIDDRGAYRFKHTGITGIYKVYGINNTLLVFALNSNRRLVIYSFIQAKSGYNPVSETQTNITLDYDSGIMIYDRTVLVASGAMVHVLRITVKNGKVSYTIISSRELLVSGGRRPLIINGHIIQPVETNSSVFLNIYDLNLELEAQRPVAMGGMLAGYWPGLMNKYILLLVARQGRRILYSYTPGGDLVLVNEVSARGLYRIEPIMNGALWLYINKTTVKSSTRYYVHVSTIDTRYCLLVGAVDSPGSVTVSIGGGGVAVAGLMKEVVTTSTGRKIMSYKIVFRYIGNIGVLIVEGLMVDLYVTDRMGHVYTYSMIKPGQPTTVPAGRVSIRPVSSIGYTGSLDNYDPVPGNIPLLGVTEINALKYNAELIISGEPAEISFIPLGHGSPFILQHPGGTLTYYLPPGRYHLVIRFEDGRSSETDIVLGGGSMETLDLSKHLPEKSIIDVLLDNIVPVTIIIVTMAAIIILIIAILTARISPAE